MASTTNVTAAKPAVTGAVSVGALTAQLPTSVSATLTGFSNLGYIHEDGMTEAMTRESEDIKSWGGDIVLNSQTSHDVKFTFTLIEAMNVDVLKTVFGDDNVSGTLSTGITVNCNSAELSAHAWVIDTVMRNNALQRIVIPNGKVSEIGDITYSDSDAVGYEITITCMPDTTQGANKFYQYIKAATP